MDSSVMPTAYPDMFLISTTDFFYPLVEDPYLQGRIACANVLSDLYAMGIDTCDNMLMLLSASLNMTAKDREIVSREMIKGFNDLATEAGTTVTGGQTVLNPWALIGGVAMSTRKTEDFVMPEHAVAGDVLVLTKPLGTQVAVNAHQWEYLKDKNWEKAKNVVTREEVMEAYGIASAGMQRLNKVAATLMIKYGAHAGTDVTGFGILGHAQNLAKNQNASLTFKIHTLPIIRKMALLDKEMGDMFDLDIGFSAETSGGLLVALPKEKAKLFIEEIQEIENCPAWIIADVVQREEQLGSEGKQHNNAIINSDVLKLEV